MRLCAIPVVVQADDLVGKVILGSRVETCESQIVGEGNVKVTSG